MTEFMIASMFLHLNHKAKALQSFLDELYLISSKLVMGFNFFPRPYIFILTFVLNLIM